MRVKTSMSFERLEVEKSRAFSWIAWKFWKSEILEILEMGFNKEWLFKPWQIAIDSYMGMGRMWSSVGQNKAT